MRFSLYRRHFIAAAVGAGLALSTGAVAWAKSPGQAKKILILGDSLSAEYGLKRGTGWVALLEQRLLAQKMNTVVVNASISGETTAGGQARLPTLLARHQPDYLVLELGGNDALRGLPIPAAQDRLSQMTRSAQQAGARVLLIGMQVPPNYGQDYAQRFAAMFKTVAQEKDAALVPFFLKGVADAPDPTRLFQNDRLHPAQEAQAIMLDNVWPTLLGLLK